MTSQELEQVTQIIREQVTSVVTSEIERALRPLRSDVNLAIRGLQGVCEALSINGKVRASFERWEEAHTSLHADRDEDTHPSIRLSVLPAEDA
jgi:hypothetical protein